MNGVYYLVPTLIAIAISWLIVRAGAIALMMTGMSFDKAKFQALSAFSGTGFTTHEAEQVVNNARRRKIVSLLMVFGNAGIVTVIVTASTSFAKAKGMEVGLNVLVLLLGISLLMALARHTELVSHWEKFAQQRLSRLKIFEGEASVDELLHIAEGYGVVRVRLQDDAEFVGKTLAEVNSGLRHSLVLGIERDGNWVPTPRMTRKLMVDDCLVIYGQLESLDQRFS